MGFSKISIPPIIPVRLYGPKGMRVVDALVDTGATYCIISPEDAHTLGYNLFRANHVPIVTAGGIIQAPILKLHKIEALTRSRKAVKTLVKDLSDGGIQAILGWSFLDRFTLKIDPKKKILEIS